LNIVQQEKEMTENILTVLKKQEADSISILEGALRLKDSYVHTLRTLDLLGSDAATNRETKSWTAGLRISADELHCQVRYDLGGIFFQQGCADQPAYEKARDHFRTMKEISQKLDVTVHLDEKRLTQYDQINKTPRRSLPGTPPPAPPGEPPRRSRGPQPIDIVPPACSWAVSWASSRVGRAWNTSRGRRPGGIRYRCPSHLNWLLPMWRSSGSTPSSSQMAELLTLSLRECPDTLRRKLISATCI
ncbi:hypothetical protein CRENBAI_013320, partial [Crenichthys baileyi]